MTSAAESTEVQCGVSPTRSRIIGGVEAEPHSWPWQCSIQTSDIGHICGCSVVAPEWIVTAAHCQYVELDVSMKTPQCYTADVATPTIRLPLSSSSLLEYSIEYLIEYSNKTGSGKFE